MILSITKSLSIFIKSAIQSNAEVSLLTRNESNAIKGILILLIVLGHNKYVQQGGMNNLYLYSFHVYAFYYLPFLYNFKNLKLTNLLSNNFIRLYVPYTIFFLLLFVIHGLSGSWPNFMNSIKTYICGSQFMLSQNFGYGSFLWFIPTMFSVLFYRWIYYHLNYTGRCIMLGISGLCLLGFTYMIPAFVTTWWYSPFCLTVALGMVLPGVILREICSRLNKSYVALAFFLLVILLMIFYPVKDEYGLTYLTINRLICPILIFSFLLSIRNYLSSKPALIEYGKLSFKIYLIHIFIYNGLYRILDNYKPGIYIGILLFFICFIVTFFISKIPLLKYVFPGR